MYLLRTVIIIHVLNRTGVTGPVRGPSSSSVYSNLNCLNVVCVVTVAHLLFADVAAEYLLKMRTPFHYTCTTAMSSF